TPLEHPNERQHVSNLLMIVTGADSLTMKDGSEHPTGFWAEELVTAHRDLLPAGPTHPHAPPRPTMKEGAEHPTGFWAEELVTAHRDLLAAGHTITIATPRGVTPTVD